MRLSPAAILKALFGVDVALMVQVPILPAFQVPPKDLQSVPVRLKSPPVDLPASAEGESVMRSMKAKTPITLLDF